MLLAITKSAFTKFPAIFRCSNFTSNSSVGHRLASWMDQPLSMAVASLIDVRLRKGPRKQVALETKKRIFLCELSIKSTLAPSAHRSHFSLGRFSMILLHTHNWPPVRRRRWPILVRC